jgi:hypothetical protein
MIKLVFYSRTYLFLHRAMSVAEVPVIIQEDLFKFQYVPSFLLF